jgi:hypothetical protein
MGPSKRRMVAVNCGTVDKRDPLVYCATPKGKERCQEKKALLFRRMSAHK